MRRPLHRGEQYVLVHGVAQLVEARKGSRALDGLKSWYVLHELPREGGGAWDRRDKIIVRCGNGVQSMVPS